MGLRNLPLLWQNLTATISARPRVVRVDTTNLSIVDNADGTMTLAAAATELQMSVHNADSIDLVKGTVVMEYSSGTGGMSVGRAFHDDNEPLLGVLAEDIVQDEVGLMQVQGVVGGLDTSGMTVGSRLFEATTPGEFTFDPSGLTYQKIVGHVVTNHATTGSIFVFTRQLNAIIHGHALTADGGQFGDTGQPPIWIEQSAPATPDAGRQFVYIDVSDHKLKRKDSSGAVTIIG